MASLDPDLIGIWLSPGSTATYEVDPQGGYHVADPEEPVRFEDGGRVMFWGGRRYARTDGSGETPIGTWDEDDTSDRWLFRADGTFDITSGGFTDTGIWALRDHGAALWTRELRARLASNGAQLTFSPVAGGNFTYGYTVAEGVWALLDPQTWVEVSRYVRPVPPAHPG